MQAETRPHKSDLNGISNHWHLICKKKPKQMLLSRLPKINLDNIWIGQKMDLGCQSEHSPV